MAGPTCSNSPPDPIPLHILPHQSIPRCAIPRLLHQPQAQLVATHGDHVQQSMGLPKSPPDPWQLHLRYQLCTVETGIQCSLPPHPHIWLPAVVYRATKITGLKTPKSPERSCLCHQQLLQHGPMRPTTSDSFHLPYEPPPQHANPKLCPQTLQAAKGQPTTQMSPGPMD